MVVRIGIDLSQICLFFFFFSFYSPTHGRRTSAGLNKSSSRSSIHLQPSDFPARRNDQTNLCDRDTSVEKVGRLKSKFKAILSPRLARHPLLPPPHRPTAVPFYSRINETWWARRVLMRSFLERAAILRQFETAFFPNQEPSQSNITRGNTDIRVFIAGRIIYHGRSLDRITDYTRLPLLIARQCPVG